MSGLTLAVDCSMRRIGLAVGRDRREICSASYDVGVKQGGRLPELVGAMLSTAGSEIGDLARVAVTIGPGYYTGIRVGLAYAAALAYAVGAEVVPITTMEALAAPFWGIGPIVAMLRATGGLAYHAAFDGGSKVEAERCSDVREAIEGEAAACPGAIFACGDDETADLVRKSGHVALNALPHAASGMLAASFSAVSIRPEEARALYLRAP